MNETQDLPAMVAQVEPQSKTITGSKRTVEAPPYVEPLPRQVQLWEPLAYAVPGFLAIVGSVAALGVSHVGATMLGGAGLLAMLGAIVQGGRIVAHETEPWLMAAGVGQILLALPFTAIGALFVMIDAAGGFRRGRQLRQRGQLQLPPLGRGTGWTTLPAQPLGAPEAKALAAQWRENGRTEHASVAAFARLSLDLLGLGAPARLLKQAQADALDEVRHTELCFSLARDLDGQDLEPVAFPAAASAGPRSSVRMVALAEVAIDSLVEGALHEGLSARVLAQLARAVSEPRIQALLAEIAADEGRHAAHAWDVLEWCVAEGGRPVKAAVGGALRALPTTMKTDLPLGARGGAWVPFGIHGEALEGESYAKALDGVLRRATALIEGKPLRTAA